MDTVRTLFVLLCWLFVANALEHPLTRSGRPRRRRETSRHNASEATEDAARGDAGVPLGEIAVAYMTHNKSARDELKRFYSQVGADPEEGPPNVSGPDLAGEIVSFEVGTLGRPVESQRYLITFDPFDGKLIAERYERLPYAVTAATEKISEFYVNKDIPGCSSLNRYNPLFDTNPSFRREKWHGERGDPHDCTPSPGEACCVERCKHPHKRGVLKVRTVRLSTMIRQRSIRRIDMLKVDAQGSDSAIVQDVLSTNVTVRTIVAECQRYDKVHPIYQGQNDCDAMVKMVHELRPGLYNNVTWRVNNCLNAEYDLIFS